MTKELEEAKAWAGGYLGGSQPMCEACLRTLLSALSRGDGWRLMPTEATPEMLDAGHMADVPWEFEELDGTPELGPFALEISGPNKPDRAKDIVAYLYRAMIAAAPPVPEGEE